MKALYKILPFIIIPLLFQACLKTQVDQDSVEFAKNDKEVKDFTDKIGGFTSQATPYGFTMYYKINHTTPKIDSLPKPTAGSQITVRYYGKLLSDTSKIFLDTYKDSLLYFAYNSNSVISGFEIGIGQMKKGQTAQFAIPSSLGFGKIANNQIPAYSSLYFYKVKLLDVRTEAQLLKAYARMVSSKDTHNIKIIDTINPSGVYYVRVKMGSGNLITTGQNVTVWYRGMIAGDNRPFDPVPTNANPKPDPSKITFNVGPTSNVITGFNDGVKFMRPGERGYILIPSTSAYSTTGSGSIPGYTPIVFRIDSIKVN